MDKSTRSFTVGMGMGVVAGLAVGVICAPKAKNAKNGVARALKNAGDIMENIGDMLGL